MCDCLALLGGTIQDLDQIGHNNAVFIQYSLSSGKPCIDLQDK